MSALHDWLVVVWVDLKRNKAQSGFGSPNHYGLLAVVIYSAQKKNPRGLQIENCTYSTHFVRKKLSFKQWNNEAFKWGFCLTLHSVRRRMICSTRILGLPFRWFWTLLTLRSSKRSVQKTSIIFTKVPTLCLIFSKILFVDRKRMLCSIKSLVVDLFLPTFINFCYFIFKKKKNDPYQPLDTSL